MSPIALLIFCLLLGIAVTRYARPPTELAKCLNWWSLNLALPALVLQIVPHLQFDRSLWFLPVAMWAMFGASWLVFKWLGMRLQWSRQRIATLILTGGLSNSAFVGFPLVEALRGKQGLSYATLADQLGCFLMVAIGGSLICALYSGRRVDHRLVARQVLLFPPFIALVTSGVIAVSSFEVPPLVDGILSRLAGTLAPLTIFAVGLQLRFRTERGGGVPLAAGLAWKLGVAPLGVFGAAVLLQVPMHIGGIAVLQAGMPPMVSAAILADQYHFDAPLANMMVGIGVIVSFLTIPMWNLVW